MVPPAPADHRKRLALAAAIMGSFVVGVDATVINVALPSISRDLGGGLAGQQWVSNAYLLALGSLILIGGSLGDVFGERRVFSLGVAGFGLASLLCAISPAIGVLVAARALQGVFGALLTPSALAVIVGAFPAAERGTAIGTWTAWVGIAAVVGPFIGGWLIEIASWRLVFFVNLPFVVLTLALIRMAVPARAPGSRTRRVDWLGAALCAGGLAGPVFALIHEPQAGWGSPAVLLGLAGGALLFVAFLVHEARTSDPMLELDLFRHGNFSAANAETLVIYGGLGITFFLLVLFLQQVAGYDALRSGLATLPTAATVFLLSKRFGRLADRHGPRLFMGGGPLLGAAGLAWLSRMPADPDYMTQVLPGLLVFSVGLSMTVAPLTAAVLADVDGAHAGIASGVNNAVARVGGLVAIAALGALVAGTFSAQVDARLAGVPLTPAAQQVVAQAKRQTFARADVAGLPPREARAVGQAVEDAAVDAFHMGMGIAAALVALGGVLGLALIRNPQRELHAEGCPGGPLAGVPEDVALETA